MPRGIVPVVALLLIASAFSQFGGTGLPATLGSGLQPSSPPPGGTAPASSAEPRKGVASPRSTPSDVCKDLTPCLPRADLGPWTASCAYAHARQDTTPRSPMVALNLAKRLSDQLPFIANQPELVDPTLPYPRRDDADRRERWCLSDANVSITPLIVTLPDPVNSHLALDFDRRIDALQAAALDAQYVLDQFWLPWSAPGAASEDSDKAGKDRVLRRLRQNQPGLQIFRSRQSKEPKALYVFLVGETPTQGVNLSQFENAIAYVREVQNAVRQSTTSEIKILGPGFSGSIPILADTLNHQVEGNACCFEIIPSSATDHDLLNSLRDAVKGAGFVRSVLHDDDAALERFLDYADHTLKIRPIDVAIVSESQTAFGSGEFTLDSTADSTAANSLNRPSSSPQQCRYNTHNSADTLRACALRLSFPREIYRLRSAYPEAPQLAAGSSRSESQPTSGLTLNLKTSAGREDDLPSFSREQLPLSQEAIMLSIAETIHRRKIKMVGVAASDVFDTLFVMRFLQEFSPDVRLFILDSDLLLVRAADNLSLQGSLAVTDYPLSSTIQSWQGDERGVRAFPSRNAELTYNGFLALIGEPRRMRDYSLYSSGETNSRDPNTQPREPLLWLTVVSRNGFQPVHLLSRVSNEGNPLPFVERPLSKPGPVTKRTAGKLEVQREYPSGGYLVFCALLLGVTLTQIVFAWYGAQCEARFLGWILEFFHISDTSAVRTQKAYLLSNSFIILAVLGFVVFLPIWRISYLRACHDGFNSLWYTLLSLLSIAIVLASMIAAAWISYCHRVFFSPERKWLVISWAIAITYYAVWTAFTLGSGSDSDFFLHRSLDLSNGASPLLPHLLLFIAFYLWSLTNLRRVHFWESRREDLDFESIDTQFRPHFAELGRDLDIALRNMLFHGHSWIILVVVLIVLLSLRPFSHIAGFEPFLAVAANIKLFDTLYVLYLLLCTTFLTHSLLRFVVCWATLQKILRRLERQPIRHAFDRLPKKFYSWSPLWQAGGARRSYALQARSLECLRKLRACGQAPPLPPNLVTDLPGLVQQLQASTSRLLDTEAAGYLDHQAENELWKANLIATADRIASDFLIPHWKDVGASESLSGGDSKSGKSDDGVRYLSLGQPPTGSEVYLVAEEFVALRFVAFMRYIGVQLRNLLSFVAAGFILCVASVRSYPFLAHRTIGWSLTIIFIALGVPVIIAFAQMGKDAILSRLSDTEPGKLDRAFYVRMISYGALPLLTVMASQFPAIGRFLFSWVQPAIEALH